MMKGLQKMGIAFGFAVAWVAYVLHGHSLVQAQCIWACINTRCMEDIDQSFYRYAGGPNGEGQGLCLYNEGVGGSVSYKRFENLNFAWELISYQDATAFASECPFLPAIPLGNACSYVNGSVLYWENLQRCLPGAEGAWSCQ
jgi:hypothetical protein